MRILAPFQPRIKGGGVITAVADYPGQALYWELVSYDPATQTEGPALGTLRWHYTRASQAKLAVNVWLASTNPAHAGLTERLYLRAADA